MLRFVKIFGALLGAECIAFAGAGTALAATPLPVTIDACRIASSHSFVSGYKPIAVSFTAQGTVPARLIRFTIEYAGHTEHVTDSGTFSNNVEIDHAFSGFFNVPYVKVSPNCSVDYVEFSDGTTWTSALP